MVKPRGRVVDEGSGLTSMMRRYGPFNPLPEIVFFLVFVLANVLIGRKELLNETARRYMWDVGLVLVFLLLVTILCIRAIKRRAMAQAFSTAGLFGFSVGSIFWCLYVLTEHVSEGLALNYQMIVSVFAYGLACSAVALALSALEICVYRVIKGKAVP